MDYARDGRVQSGTRDLRERYSIVENVNSVVLTGRVIGSPRDSLKVRDGGTHFAWLSVHWGEGSNVHFDFYVEGPFAADVTHFLKFGDWIVIIGHLDSKPKEFRPDHEIMTLVADQIRVMNPNDVGCFDASKIVTDTAIRYILTPKAVHGGQP